MGHLGRLLTAMVTPFDAEGRVDYDRAKELALALLASGSDGLIVSGTTGESPTLTRDEKLRLFQEIKSIAGDATKLRRYKARSRGRVSPRVTRLSHIEIVVEGEAY